jgi:hypothetical protein
MENSISNYDWLTLTQFFPAGWEDKAYELGVLTRKRKFKSPSDLLRVLLIHLSDHCSLKEAVTLAKLGDLVDISDVALLKKIVLSSEWFRWMTLEIIKKRLINFNCPKQFLNYNIKTVDASVITEPGSTGTDWRLHYSLELFKLKCDEFKVTKPNIGESFRNFNVQSNDLYIGDRAYNTYLGIKHILSSGGQFLTRYRNRAFTFYDEDMVEFKLIDKLETLEIGEMMDINAYIGTKNNENIKVRVCALKKSEQMADKAINKTLSKHNRKQSKINPITLEYHKYMILVTSLPSELSASDIMNLYRLRWQIELTFKKLKSIFGLGHLPKKDERAARAWLHGKLFVAMLTHAIIDESLFFSPWGYPIQSEN